MGWQIKGLRMTQDPYDMVPPRNPETHVAGRKLRPRGSGGIS